MEKSIEIVDWSDDPRWIAIGTISEPKTVAASTQVTVSALS
jgi:hypothetical protein